MRAQHAPTLANGHENGNAGGALALRPEIMGDCRWCGGSQGVSLYSAQSKEFEGVVVSVETTTTAGKNKKKERIRTPSDDQADSCVSTACDAEAGEVADVLV